MARMLFVVCVLPIWIVASGAASPSEVPVAWQAGRQYDKLDPPRRSHTANGQVEVIEFFWYGCNHCNALDPLLSQWLNKRPPGIVFERVPVPWQMARPHARLYYALVGLNRTDLHSEVFEEIFTRGNRMSDRDEGKTMALQVAFAKAHGIAEKDFVEMYKSSLVDRYVERANELASRYEVAGVPTVVVNGKYVSNDDRAGGVSQLAELTQYLAERERVGFARDGVGDKLWPRSAQVTESAE